MTEAVEPSKNRLPVGLVVFACIQLFLAAVNFKAVVTYSSQGLYSILPPLITGVAMVVTGIGYLRRSWVFGFLGGNLLAVGSIANILVFCLLAGFAILKASIPGIIHAVLLLGFLNFRYKETFKAARGAT